MRRGSRAAGKLLAKPCGDGVAPTLRRAPAKPRDPEGKERGDGDVGQMMGAEQHAGKPDAQRDDHGERTEQWTREEQNARKADGRGGVAGGKGIILRVSDGDL